MHLMQIGRTMTFDEFLKTRNITLTAAAEKLGRDVTLIGRYRSRKVTPSPEVIADIVEWSDGEVSPRDLLAVPQEAESAA